MYSRRHHSAAGAGAHKGHSAETAAGRHQTERPDPPLGQNTHTHTHTQTCRRPYCKGSKHKLIHDTLCCITSSIRQPSHTTSSCTCRRWPCRSTTRLCVRAVSCMIQDSSTLPTCETCSYQSSRMFTTHLRATVPPVHRHSKSFSQSDYYLGFESKP